MEVEGTQVEQSTVLSEEEVQQVVEGQGDEITLESDKEQFEMPDKFAGKSAEEIAKAYLELEKLKAKQAGEQEGGDSKSAEEDANQEEEETKPKELTKIEEAKLQEYEKTFNETGSLSEEQYSELEEAGYTREQVDREIEFREYQQVKAVEELTGDTIDKFKEVVKWAHENKTPEEIKEFNEALKGSNKLGQQALLKTLYAEAAKGSTEDVTLHTNTPQKTASKGYANESELFADMNNPAYKNDPKYQQKVMDKLSVSDTTGWSF